METIFEDNFITSADALESVDKEEDSPIKEFLRDKTVFVTGGFGFLGKLLIEKLLRCDVKKIYLLARAKKGKSLEERFETLVNEPIFIKLLKLQKNPFAKLSLIKGDLQEINLGISVEDQRTLTNEVEILFHAAADVRFDESLKEATEINVRGTREIMLLAQQMHALKVFVYVSTAFCTPGFYVRENFYKTHLDPDFMIKLVENLHPSEWDDFEAIARRIIQPYPNTYTYTKALSEHVVRKYGKNLRTAIIRPSIVTTTLSDPMPGYTDNLYGVNGVVTGAGVGAIRILHIDNNLKANIVPSDYVVNSILAIAWFTFVENNNNFPIAPNSESANDKDFYHDFNNEAIKIYHCTLSENNPVRWADVKEKTSACGKKYPIKRALWVICYNTTSYYYVCQVLKIFYHFLPALIIDKLLVLNKKQPKLLKIYRKINKFSEVLEFFTNNEWTFENENMKKLQNAMTTEDKKIFRCDMNFRWDEFFEIFCAGLRKYICKEELDTLPEARKRYRRMEILHHLLLAVIYSVLAFVSFKILEFYGLIDYLAMWIARSQDFSFIKFDAAIA